MATADGGVAGGGRRCPEAATENAVGLKKKGELGRLRHKPDSINGAGCSKKKKKTVRELR
jgi:hypothetical protein